MSSIVNLLLHIWYTSRDHSSIDRRYNPYESTSRNNSSLVFMVSSVRVGAPFKSMTKLRSRHWWNPCGFHMGSMDLFGILNIWEHACRKLSLCAENTNVAGERWHVMGEKVVSVILHRFSLPLICLPVYQIF